MGVDTWGKLFSFLLPPKNPALRNFMDPVYHVKIRFLFDFYFTFIALTLPTDIHVYQILSY